MAVTGQSLWARRSCFSRATSFLSRVTSLFGDRRDNRTRAVRQQDRRLQESKWLHNRKELLLEWMGAWKSFPLNTNILKRYHRQQHYDQITTFFFLLAVISHLPEQTIITFDRSRSWLNRRQYNWRKQSHTFCTITVTAAQSKNRCCSAKDREVRKVCVEWCHPSSHLYCRTDSTFHT